MKILVSTTRTIWTLVGVSVLMFCFGFVLVPLYDLFCDITGINGKVDSTAVVYDPASVNIDITRTMELRSVVVNNAQMPWKMQSKQKKLTIHPGKVYQMKYTIHNPTDRAMYAQAIPSIAPSNGAQYLKKIQCFCFDQIQLGADKRMEADVIFYIDPNIPNDIPSLILSYTLFDVTSHVTN